jgi:hypothetical protein
MPRASRAPTQSLVSPDSGRPGMAPDKSGTILENHIQEHRYIEVTEQGRRSLPDKIHFD